MLTNSGNSGASAFDPQTELAYMFGRLLHIDTAKLLDVVYSMESAGIGYHLGSKARLNQDIANISNIDCSGFVRYAIYHATNNFVRMPDGSWNQDDWCRRQGFAVVNYRNSAGALDNRVRIAFMHGGRIGHVWLVLNGQTIESHGHAGPDRREWTEPVLLSHVSKCYLLS